MNQPARKPRSAWQNLLIAVAAMLALVAGYYLGNIASGKKPELKTATVLPQPKALEDFSLVDKNNQPLTLDSLKGKWTLAFFGYTYCPDICPTALTSMAEVSEALGSMADQTRTLFISVDPQRDTPDHMKKYVEFFNPDFDAATGEDTQLRALTRQVGVQYKLHEPDKDGNYLVDHSAWLIILNPAGQFHAVISGSHYPNPAGMAADIQQIIDSY